MINKYNNFLFEKLYEGSKQLNENQFWKLFNKNCKDYTCYHNSMTDNNLIFKSMNLNVDYFMISDNLPERKSIHNPNYYTLLINNLDSWKKYPKRQQICSLSEPWFIIPKDGLYVIIPFDNSKWGVVPDDDIWGVEFFGLELSNFDMLFNTYIFTIKDNSWDEFLKDVEIADKEYKHEFIIKLEQYLKLDKKAQNFINSIKNKFSKKKYIDFYKKFFTPNNLNFELYEHKDLIKNKKLLNNYKHEVWTDSNSLYVDYEIFIRDILPKIKKEND